MLSSIMESMDMVPEGCGREGAGAGACCVMGGALILPPDGLEASLTEP